MKPYIILAFVVCSVTQIQAQTPTNIFPENGNAGIGTTSPGTSALTIERSNNDGGSTNAPYISIKNTSAANPAGNGYNLAWADFYAGNGAVLGQVGANYGVGWAVPWNIGSGFYITTRTDHPIIFTTGTASTEKMRITNAGNVGIGIPNPDAKLTVNGDNAILKIVNSGGRTIGNTFGHEFAVDGHTQSGVGGTYLVNTGGANGIHDYRINLWDGSTSAAERLRIQGSTGHIGIGTTNPSARLQVAWGASSAYMLNSNTGLGDLWGFTGANGYNFTINSFAPSTGNLKTALGINYSVDGSNGYAQYVRSGLKKAPMILMDADNGSLSLYGESGSGSNYRSPTLNLGIAVASNGMVGVGSTSPTEKLDVTGNVKTTGYMLIGATSLPAADAKLAVNGHIYSTKIKVTQNGWADYVFDPTYRLRPLTEVEQYIQQHHHLPEVPTAEEVEKEGLDLGDNQATLLKKVEELTLYLIEQNKKIEQLQKELKAIKKEKQK